jgi:hypothetical protein
LNFRGYSLSPNLKSSLESAAIIKRDFNDIPTPVQPNAVYRLLGAVSFTVTQIAPGILEMAVRNQLTRGVTAGLTYTEGSDQEATSTSVGPRSVQMLRIYPLEILADRSRSLPTGCLKYRAKCVERRNIFSFSLNPLHFERGVYTQPWQ